MRQLVSLESRAAAQQLIELLYGGGVDGDLRSTQDGKWSVWIIDDADLPRARELLEVVEQSPEDPRLTTLLENAQQMRQHETGAPKPSPAKTVSLRERWQAAAAPIPLGFATSALILVCVVVAFATRLSPAGPVVQALAIATTNLGLVEVADGQVWRLVTPIFLHFGFLHLIFNMLWLKDLGSMIEHRQSSPFLGFLVLVIAVSSNFAQYLASSPAFGGMSGVVYGLFGYAWIRGRFDVQSGLFVAKNTAVFLLVWLVICFAGIVGQVANTAHVVGLITGAGWGYLASGHWKQALIRR